MITHEEALDFLVKNLPLEAQQTTSIYHTAIRVLLQALTELEELKRDVARYFELEGNYQKSSHEYHETEYIKNKLMEVGKEE